MNIYEGDIFIDNDRIDIYEINPINAPIDLLLKSDPYFNNTSSYIKNGRVIVATRKNVIIGVIIFLKREKDTYEIMNLIVEEKSRGNGVAKELLKVVDSKMIPLRASTLIIGARNSSIEKLGLYQRFGFRISRVEKDYYCFNNYKENIWENGILCRDRIIFEKKYQNENKILK